MWNEETDSGQWSTLCIHPCTNRKSCVVTNRPHSRNDRSNVCPIPFWFFTIIFLKWVLSQIDILYDSCICETLLLACQGEAYLFYDPNKFMVSPQQCLSDYIDILFPWHVSFLQSSSEKSSDLVVAGLISWSSAGRPVWFDRSTMPPDVQQLQEDHIPGMEQDGGPLNQIQNPDVVLAALRPDERAVCPFIIWVFPPVYNWHVTSFWKYDITWLLWERLQQSKHVVVTFFWSVDNKCHDNECIYSLNFNWFTSFGICTIAYLWCTFSVSKSPTMALQHSSLDSHVTCDMWHHS